MGQSAGGAGSQRVPVSLGADPLKSPPAGGGAGGGESPAGHTAMSASTPPSRFVSKSDRSLQCETQSVTVNAHEQGQACASRGTSVWFAHCGHSEEANKQPAHYLCGGCGGSSVFGGGDV